MSVSETIEQNHNSGLSKIVLWARRCRSATCERREMMPEMLRNGKGGGAGSKRKEIIWMMSNTVGYRLLHSFVKR